MEVMSIPVIVMSPVTARPYAAASSFDSPNWKIMKRTDRSRNQLTNPMYIWDLSSGDVYSTLNMGMSRVLIP